VKVILRPVAEFSGQFRGELLCAARRRCFERFETSRVNAQVAAEYLRILKKKCLI